MRGVFITGTDTSVGKTTIAAGMAWSMRKNGIDVGVMKPFATASRKYSSKYKSEDVALLAKAADVKDPDEEINPFFSPIPTAPYVASMIQRSKKVDIFRSVRAYFKLASQHRSMIVEGIGGIFVPLTRKICVADFVSLLDLPVIIVARAKLGMINDIQLTLRACYDYHLIVKGVIINHVSDCQDPFEQISIESIQRLTGVRILATVPFLKTNNPKTVALHLEKHPKLNEMLNHENC